MGFPRSHQPKSCVTSNSSKWGLDIQICRFSQKSHAGKVVPECYKDDVESQWKNLKLDPCYPKTPEPVATEIGSGDYVPDIYPCAKLHIDPIRGFCPPHMRSCLPNVHSASFGGSSNSLPPRPLADFDDQYVKRRRCAQGCAFRGSRKQKKCI